MSAGRAAALAAILSVPAIAGDGTAIGSPSLVWSGDEVSSLGSPTRDGSRLTIVDEATGDLALRSLTDGEVVRLTQSGGSKEFAYFSVPSRDGRRVAYAWFNADGFYELRLAESDGSAAPKILYRNPESGFVQPCAFSPDGDQVLTLFFRKDNISRIALVSIEDGSVRTLKSLQWIYPKRMDLSPDGRFIVYDNLSSNGAKERDVFLLAVDGSRETRLIGGDSNDLFPLWSVSGDAVLFSSDRSGTPGLWTVRVADGEAVGEPRLLRDGMGRFLPLGVTEAGSLVYSLRSGGAQLVETKLDGTSPRSIFPDGESSDRFFPQYSPDGRAVAYLTRVSSENYGQEHRAVVVRELPEGPEREVPDRMAHVERLSWGPEGRRLLLQGSDRRGRAGLFVFDLETQRTTPLATGAADFRGFSGALLADGSSVVARRRTLVRINPESRDGTQLATLEGSADLLTLDDAGDRLAFAQLGAEQSVWIGDSDGEGLRKVLDLPSGDVTDVEWSDDGQSLLIGTRASDGARLFLVSAKGDRIRPIATPKDRLPGLSVRGDRLAFARGAEREEIWRLDGVAAPR